VRVNEGNDVERFDLPINVKKILDILPGFVWSASPEGAIQYFNKRGLEYTGFSLDEVNGWSWMDSGLLHPNEIQSIKERWSDILASGKGGEIQARMRRNDGEYLWFLFRVAPLHNDSGKLIAWWGVDIEIDERKKMEDELIRSQGYLAEAQKLSRTGSFSIDPSTSEIWCSEEAFNVIGYEKGTKPTVDKSFSLVHPDDLQRVQELFKRGITDGGLLEWENKAVMPDGSIKHLRVVAHTIKLSSGLSEFVGAISDITKMKLAEQEIRQKEKEFRQIVEAVPCLIISMTSDGELVYANNNLLNYTGLKQEDVILKNFRERIFHPVDFAYMRSKREEVLLGAKAFETETRILGKDGKYRWFLTRFSPLKDDNAKVVQWYATAMDINDRKQQEDIVKNENIALREVINKISDLDIIGTSKPIKNIHHLISLVALTNSSILILGETGTGKELVARGVHNISKRKDKLMIKVNCAALPSNLIESELFGHEKGSFTGAFERRIGKFELANHSTLFLDEIGELPLELQVKLLRVLQEKEFERVGGKETIKVDVRIIAASNRNLLNEVKNGNFRSDLYYRLNVFPITVPPLRERKADIPILANHFLAKYSKNIGKIINTISGKVMEELINYSWPGNVRELEHLIERSVILNDNIISDIHLPQIEPIKINEITDGTVKTIFENEREYILSVLRKCKGKKAGSDGAAALLGVPVSTLNSKLKKLGITKDQIYSA
jgi:PAS domain S-box-containing protein